MRLESPSRKSKENDNNDDSKGLICCFNVDANKREKERNSVPIKLMTMIDRFGTLILFAPYVILDKKESSTRTKENKIVDNITSPILIDVFCLIFESTNT